MIKGIDISIWQGDPDFSKVKEDGYDFVIIKAVEGTGLRDDKLSRNQFECREKGLILGYYAYVRPDLGNSPEEEAQYLLNHIGELQKNEFIVLDFEVSFSAAVSWCGAWLDYIFEKTGIRPLIYLNKSLQNSFDWSSVIERNYGLWLADYTYDPESEIPITQWDFVAMRQYSNKGQVAGINGNVDLNVFYGDIEALKAYGYGDSEPTPTPDPEPCYSLDDDIPTEVEEEFHLKDKSWYNKHWTFREFIEYSINANQDEMAIRAFLQYINAKLTGSNPVAPLPLKEEQENLQFNIDVALQKIENNITKDLSVFADKEIRDEYINRILDSILKKLGLKSSTNK